MNKKTEKIPEFPSYKRDANNALILSATSILISLLICAYVIISSNKASNQLKKEIGQLNNQIYVIDQKDGSIFLARKKVRDKETQKLEHQEVARLYMLNMYSFDKHTYHDRMTKAIQLSNEKTGVKEFEKYQEKNIYSNLLYHGLALSAVIDSITTTEQNVNNSKGIIYAKQWIHKPNGSLGYQISYKYEVENTQTRNQENMYGAQITSFQIYQKTDLK